MLPEKFSELITVALKDYATVRERPLLYKLDAYAWHKPDPMDEHRRTSVCLAGCVMAISLNTPHDKDVTPYSFSSSDRKGLFFINTLRGPAFGLRSFVGSIPYAEFGYADFPAMLRRYRDIFVKEEAKQLGFRMLP